MRIVATVVLDRGMRDSQMNTLNHDNLDRESHLYLLRPHWKNLTLREFEHANVLPAPQLVALRAHVVLDIRDIHLLRKALLLHR